MVNEVKRKNQTSILSKYCFYIALFFSSFALFGQDSNTEKLWKSEKEKYNFQKDKAYKGPKNWHGDPPSSLKKEVVEQTEENYNGIEYNPQKIKKNRRKKKRSINEGQNSGDYNPSTGEEEPLEELPEREKKEESAIEISPLWKILFYAIVFGLIIFIAYLAIKNRKPRDISVPINSSDSDWNPEVITKTELEILLEKSIVSENYREGVRVYFTFILKELIRKGWIKWKQDKTNFNYILEMKNKPNSMKFEECVRIYDLVWYGQYQIEKDHFETIQPILLAYYQSLQKEE